jgi:hypothetical protein
MFVSLQFEQKAVVEPFVCFLFYIIDITSLVIDEEAVSHMYVTLHLLPYKFPIIPIIIVSPPHFLNNSKTAV